MEESGVSFSLGEKFESFEAVRGKISRYKESHSVQLCRSDSRTLEAAGKRVPLRVEKANRALVYYEINFSCVFGGRQYKRKGSGKRPHQR